MYLNVIDPNLTAVRERQGKYRWTAAEFVMEEGRVSVREVVVALQGSARRTVGRGL